QAACSFDPWFLEQLQMIVDAEKQVEANGLPTDPHDLRDLKALGFSDTRLAELTGTTEADIRKTRSSLGVKPVFKRIDTCAAEFKSQTPYMYSTYETDFAGNAACEAEVSSARKAIILGGGPNRIGQGIEFDYCCCHAAFALSDAGIESIMV
ncbi:MAG TPA: carbamoyl phosphate synthase large subunit, partial [Oceanicaulis sp.]|nr:carbamoyl phosphate synthase large subunit [Oceanicaulis sp.]